MSKGVSSYGAAFQVGTAAGSYSTDLGCTVSGTLPLPDQQFSEDKCLGQTSRIIKSIPGFQDAGMMTTVHKYNQDVVTQLLTWFQTEPPPELYAKMTFPKEVGDDGSVQAAAAEATFRVYLKSAPIEIPEGGDRMTMTVSWKINSDVTFTEGDTV
jgi:hypothetical protein